MKSLFMKKTKKGKVFWIDRKKQKWMVILILFMFFCVNSTSIKLWWCSDNGCYTKLDRSQEWYTDIFIESYTNVYLAPTALLLPKVFDNGDFIVEDKNIWWGDIWELIDSKSLNNFSTEANNSWPLYYFWTNHKKEPKQKVFRIWSIIPTDSTNFTMIFLIIKLIISLSLPLWIIILYGLYQLFKFNRILWIVTWEIILMFLLFYKSITIFFLYVQANTNITLSHIFTRNIYFWVIVFFIYIFWKLYMQGRNYRKLLKEVRGK